MKQIKQNTIMKKFAATFLFFFLIGFTVLSSAQTVWKITRDDLNNPSYIVMTDPYVEASFISEMKGLDEATKNTQVVYCELTPEDFKAGIPSLSNYIILPQDNNLKGYLTDSSLNLIKQTIVQYGNDTLASIFHVLHPDFIRLCLSSDTQTLNSKTNDINQLIDFALIQKIASDGRSVIGFETFDDVMSFGFPADIIGNRVQSLVQFCRNIDNNRTLNKRITKAYKQNDLLMLDQLINEKKASGQIERFNLMNQKWTISMINTIHEQPTLFIINDSYLFGKSGIMELLRKKGYLVEAVDE